jgi:hypothetical protein
MQATLRDVSFTKRELDVVSILWRRGSGTVAEVREELDAPVAYTSVLRVLQTLTEKGAVHSSLRSCSRDTSRSRRISGSERFRLETSWLRRSSGDPPKRRSSRRSVLYRRYDAFSLSRTAPCGRPLPMSASIWTRQAWMPRTAPESTRAWLEERAERVERILRQMTESWASAVGFPLIQRKAGGDGGVVRRATDPIRFASTRG